MECGLFEAHAELRRLKVEKAEREERMYSYTSRVGLNWSKVSEVRIFEVEAGFAETAGRGAQGNAGLD